jgi:hypothetical protein
MFGWLKSERKKQHELPADERNGSSQENYWQQIIGALNAISEKTGAQEHKSYAAKAYKYTIEVGTLLGLWVAAGVALYAICKSSIDSAGQRGVMQRQLDEMEAEQRPWVVGTVPDQITVSFAGYQGHSGLEMDISSLQFQLHNTGKTPAFNVWPDWRIIASPIAGVAATQQVTCAQGRSEIRKRYREGVTVFPDQILPLAPNGSSVSPEAVSAVSFPPVSQGGTAIRSISPMIVGCLTYFERRGNGETVHQTGFAYEMGFNGNIRNYYFGGSAVPVVLGSRQVSLRPSAVFGQAFFAN